MTAKETLDSVDLDALSDTELLEHLDRVSENLKKRNSLIPSAGPSPVDGILNLIRNAAVAPRSPESG